MHQLVVKKFSRRKQLLDVLKNKTGYWKLKEETLDRSVFGELALEEGLD